MKLYLLTLLACVSCVVPGTVSAQQPSATEAAPPAVLPPEKGAAPEGYVIAMRISEMPGAPLSVGAAFAGTPLHAAEAPDDEQRNASRQAGVNVLSAPQITVLPRQTATVEITGEQIFTYLESDADGRYIAKRSEPKKLGLKIAIKAEPAAEDESVVLCRLECETSTLVGREPVKGLDLDVGKPIVATWSLKTTSAAKFGTPALVILPSGPNRTCLLTIEVTKGPPAPDEKKALPSPSRQR